MQSRPPTAMSPVYVAVETGPHAGMTVTWREPGSYLIGRASHAQLALIHDLLASLEHCRLEIGSQGCIIRDLGSRQGTALNGTSVSHSQVRSGDVLNIGMSRVRVTLGDTLPATELLAPGEQRSAATAAWQPAPTAGATILDIPGYAIVRKIGQGGMGVVYEAKCSESGERVAIKTIIPAPGTAEKSVRLFQREMKLLSQLAHPGIVRFIESGEHAGQIYLVMEYVDSVDLRSLLNSLPRPRQVAIACGVICQMLDALQYAHERKLVHRDVKPSNILVARSGQKLHAKLADFGLAKNFELAGLSQLTGDNELRGTLAFMPWEQLHRSRYVKPTADIYSAAATLFFLLTGRTPGHSEPPRRSWFSLTALLPGMAEPQAANVGDPTTESGLGELSSDLAAVLRRALSYDPARRFATAVEMRDAVTRCLPDRK